MRAMLRQLFVSIALLAAASAPAAPGDVDPTFVYPTPQVLEPDSTNAVPLVDGFLVIRSRNFGAPGVDSTLEVTRIDQDGRVVATYGTGGTATIRLPGATNVSTAVKRLPSGAVLLGGFRADPGASDHNLAVLVQLDPDGRLDSAFGNGGIAAFSVDGDLARVAAIDTVYGDAILAAVWSRYQTVAHDCSYDRVTLFQLSMNGAAPAPIYSAPVRNSFDRTCRGTVSLRFLDSYAYYGFNSICDDSTLLADAEALFLLQGGNSCRHWGGGGILHLDGGQYTRLGIAAPNGSGIGFMVDYDPPARLPWLATNSPPAVQLGALAGYRGAVLPTALTLDNKSGAWYLGFSNDFGEAGLAKYRADGVLDDTWGGGDGVVPIYGSGRPGARDGVLNVSEGLATDVRMVSVQSSGNVVVATADGIVRRFLGPSADFPAGWLALQPSSIVVTESTPRVSLQVARVGDPRGVIGVDYEVFLPGQCDAATGVGCVDANRELATPGLDFVTASGRLEWGDGDGQSREITVPIVDDALYERTEKFYVRLMDASGSAIVIGLAEITIMSDDPPTPSGGGAAGGAGGGGDSGGGGAATWPLLALLGLRALARYSRQVLMVVLSVLGLSGLAHGRAGDMDPGFGNGGVLRVGQLGLPLQNGRLLYRMEGGYARTDADGHPDPAFGRQGVQEWPAGFNPGNGFRAGVSPSAWARTREGGLLAAGTLPGADTPQLAVLKLRGDGSIDAKFGKDGLARVPTSLGSLTQPRWIEQELVVQPDGKILVLTEVHRNSYDVIEDMELARLLPDGAPDSSFGTDGIVKTAQGIGSEWVVLDVLKDGRIRISGDILIYLAPSGAPDAGSPTDDPELGLPARHWAIGSWTADGGVVVTSSESDPRLGKRYFFAKLNADGTLDRGFGPPGSGVLEVAGSVTSTWTLVGHACSPDGRFLFLSLSTGPYHQAVARYRVRGPGAGALDPDFGEGGIVDLGRMYWSGSIVGTSDGGLIVHTLGNALRLFGIDRASPGFVDFSSTQQTAWRETDGRIEVRVSRLAGASGTIRVRYSTPSIDPHAQDEPTAQAGVDFEPVAGELVWVDGDGADKSFFIPLLTDGSVEPLEALVVNVSSATPGAWARQETLYLGLADVSSPVFAGPTAPGSNPTGAGDRGSGGGGAFGPLVVMMLGLLRMLSRRIAA